MDNSEKAERTSAAVIAQLNAELKANEYNVKSMAAALRMDYNTYRRYLNGEREIPVLALWATLAQLDLGIDVFAQRAKDRLTHG